MLDRTLERGSLSYRKGYRDGFARGPFMAPGTGIASLMSDVIGGTIRPFADYDYTQGYAAGANDDYWPAMRSGEILPLAPKSF